MAETDKFKAWHKIECCKATGALAEAESRVERLMHPSKMNVEVFNGQKWVPFTDTI
jgi:hypothetical protein